MDQGLYTGTVLIDLQKAFDTVDHTILSHKLKAIGMDNTSQILSNGFNPTCLIEGNMCL